MSRAVLVLHSDAIRDRARHWVNIAPPGTRIEFKEAKRSTEQNAKMWACLTDVADQVEHYGQRFSADDWKIIFLDALKGESIRMVPNLDGNGYIPIGRSSSDLSVKEMADLIELILMFGANNDVKFHYVEE